MTLADGRKKKLQKHIKTLKAGGDVSKRDMRAVLTDEQMQIYKDTWRNIKDFEGDMAETPDVLKGYTDMLRVADGIYNKGKVQKAEGAYERALEHLDELLEQDPNLRIYIDREFDFAKAQVLTAEGVPRLTNSRSKHGHGGLGGRKIKEHKLGILEDALDKIINAKANAQAKAASNARLKKFRNDMRNKYK